MIKRRFAAQTNVVRKDGTGIVGKKMPSIRLTARAERTVHVNSRCVRDRAAPRLTSEQ